MANRVTHESQQQWLLDGARSVVRILRRQRANRFLILDKPAVGPLGSTAIAGIGSPRSFPTAYMELWLEPGPSGTSSFSFWISSEHRADLLKVARAGDSCFPTHHEWNHRDDRDRPPYDRPVLDLRHRKKSIYNGESFYGVWLGEYIASTLRPLPQLLRTDIAYFFYQIGAITLGQTGDSQPTRYGRLTSGWNVTAPSRKSVLSKFGCPVCRAALRSYDEMCERCNWTVGRQIGGTAVEPLFPDETADT